MIGFAPDFSAIESPVVEDYDGSALRMFKDCHTGGRCFIIGNGPSLRDTELSSLAGEITFGANGIFYMTQQCGFTPTYYVVEDNHVFEDNLSRIKSVDAVAKFFPSKYRSIIEPRQDTYFLPTDWAFYWGSSEWYEKPRFSHDVSSVIYAGQTVTFMSLQLAAYMGFKEIYLVGVDYDYQIPEEAQVDGLTITSVADDPNHFHPEYFGKGKKWHMPKLENVGLVMEAARRAAQDVDCEIFNATIGGALEVFPRVDYRALVERPEIPDPNSAIHYLLARGLDRSRQLGAETVALDPSAAGDGIEQIVFASSLTIVESSKSDVLITQRAHFEGRAAGTRALILEPSVPADGLSRTADLPWLTELVVECLATGGAAFWSRSQLEISPDGESAIVPALGRMAQQTVDPMREIGINGVGNLADARSTRWANGRRLSIEQIVTLIDEVLEHRLSVGVVDGYLYVQSPWKATEDPRELIC